MRMIPLATETIDRKRPILPVTSRHSGDRVLTSDSTTWVLHDVVAKQVLGALAGTALGG